MKTVLTLVAAIAMILAPSCAGGGTTPIERGDSAEFWEDWTVVLGEVESPLSAVRKGHGQATGIRPIATLTGRFDSSRFRVVTIEAWLGEWRPYRSVYPSAKGQTVLLAFRDFNGSMFGCGYCTGGRTAFIRESEEPMEVLSGLGDPQIEQTVREIQLLRGHQRPYYWAAHAVVYARVKALVGPRASQQRSMIILRPIATLAGAFDAGRTPEAAAPVSLQKFGPAKGPAAGDAVLAVLQREGESFAVADAYPEFMPEIAGRRALICVVHGFSDPRVTETVIRLRDLAFHSGHARAPFSLGDHDKTAPASAEFWETCSVALVVVSDTRPGADYDVALRPAATITGRLDASRVAGLGITLPPALRAASPNYYPRVAGAHLLVVLRNVGNALVVPRGPVPFMRDSGEPVEAVKDISDAQVEATLKAIQTIRKGEKPAYWTSHAVVLAYLDSLQGAKRGGKKATALLLPIMTLAGNFDAGKTPEVTVNGDLKAVGLGAAPRVGDSLLVVLERDDETYRIADERPAYMPAVNGRRSAVCVVTGLGDRKVMETVDALKTFRKAVSLPTTK